jgi:hypothetical protein
MTTVAGDSYPAMAESDGPVAAGAPRRPGHGLSSTMRRGRLLAARIGTVLRDDPLLIAVLVSSFVARLLIADRNSYWYDEMLSVQVYAGWHDSPLDALELLRADSVHPPLYQLILHYWVEWFGEGERATRSLSNLFVLLATLFLYLLVRDAFSQRLALLSAITFALMYSPTYYALEARSYAQTMFLATLSSFALLRLMRAGHARGWRRALRSPTALLFMVAGAALLLTHYFNAFFWCAQGLIVGVFVLRERPPRSWPAGLGVVAAMYAVQAGVFAVVWGPALLEQYREMSGGFDVGNDGVASPYDLLAQTAMPNLDAPRVVWWAAVAVGVVLGLRALRALVESGPEARQPAWATAYLCGWLLLPFFVVSLTFEITGIARYYPRYWLAAMPALAPLLVLLTSEATRLVRLGLRRRGGVSPPFSWLSIATAAAVVTFVLPGTVAAATGPKDEPGEFRDLARRAVELIEADPEHDYLVIEAVRYPAPLVNLYLERFSNEVRAGGILWRDEVYSGEYRILTTYEPVIAEHDHLMLLFTHVRISYFPEVLTALDERYDMRLRQIVGGRGLIVYDVRPHPAGG